jgi:hypothetical protein
VADFGFRTTTLHFGEILLASILRQMQRRGGVFPFMSVVVVNPLGYSHRFVILSWFCAQPKRKSWLSLVSLG